MLSHIELEYLRCPERFEANYARVLKHRIKDKARVLNEELTLLNAAGFLNITENRNGVTEFSNGQRSSNQAGFAEMRWAGPDLNRRPLARKANVLTKLDDRPILCPSD